MIEWSVGRLIDWLIDLLISLLLEEVSEHTSLTNPISQGCSTMWKDDILYIYSIVYSAITAVRKMLSKVIIIVRW